MQYWANHKYNQDKMTDIFNNMDYLCLKTEHPIVNGKKQAQKFFSNDQDIALGLSTDGFALFKHRKHTCWALILFNYNLPPNIRCQLEYIICMAVIPGPQKPKDFDSFLWPLVEELLRLEVGIATIDRRLSEIFSLCTFLICVFGDIPAISMVMCMKGHNGFCPCCMCNITGVLIPNSQGAGKSTYYVPLDQSQHPAV